MRDMLLGDILHIGPYEGRRHEGWNTWSGPALGRHGKPFMVFHDWHNLKPGHNWRIYLAGLCRELGVGV